MNTSKNKTVYIVHNIDTEGPLYESLRANFERVEEMFGHKIDCSEENLVKLQNMKIDLDGDEELVQRLLLGERIGTHGTWDQIDRMLDDITSTNFRNQLLDSERGGWIYNWLCMSHVGITGINPRRRDMGYHNIFDHYQEYFDKRNDNCDLIQWHYHALSLTNDAHRCGSAYLNSSHIYNILARGIIERNWFPTVFRAGHNTERPDSNLFLEQWIPFDYSNASAGFDESNTSSSYARYGDWRRAPRSWRPYHPDHDDYQKIGNCRRYIARCLSMDDREYSITIDDVREAFKEAEETGASILSFTNHDFRQMGPDIELVRNFISSCQKEFAGVNIKFSNAIDAMRGVLGIEEVKEIDFIVELKEYKTYKQLIVKATNDIFGPQPFLAIKNKSNKFFWQNFDFESDNVWSYSFDADNILIDSIDMIGIASNTASGLTEIVTLNLHTGEQKRTVLNV